MKLFEIRLTLNGKVYREVVEAETQADAERQARHNQLPTGQRRKARLLTAEVIGELETAQHEEMA